MEWGGLGNSLMRLALALALKHTEVELEEAGKDALYRNTFKYFVVLLGQKTASEFFAFEN